MIPTWWPSSTPWIIDDCRTVIDKLPDNSVDLILTDPPYGLHFMNKDWDKAIPGIDYWQRMLRVAKPGAHLLSFGGTRMFHRLACAIEDSGWDFRDTCMWTYSSGFPKSRNVSMAIDEEAGAERKVIGERRGQGSIPNTRGEWGLKPNTPVKITEPATKEAKEWDGYGSALKPSWEPVLIFRKSLEGTLAANVLKWKTGALNIDECRVPTNDKVSTGDGMCGIDSGWDRPWKHDPDAVAARKERVEATIEKTNTLGRWPANLIHDGSKEVLKLFPDSDGCQPHIINSSNKKYEGWGSITNKHGEMVGYPDIGSAARFFYCAKPSASERGDSTHPTIKPLKLLEYLIRLTTRENYVILDPFLGSGSILEACMNTRRIGLGIEIDKENEESIRQRSRVDVPKLDDFHDAPPTIRRFME